VPLQSGWAIYLRTSSKETQNPERSRDRQRFKIFNALVLTSDFPTAEEYADVESGTSTDRLNYQRMLQGARQGKFSHIAAENAERFGRDDAEALRANPVRYRSRAPLTAMVYTSGHGGMRGG